MDVFFLCPGSVLIVLLCCHWDSNRQRTYRAKCSVYFGTFRRDTKFRFCVSILDFRCSTFDVFSRLAVGITSPYLLRTATAHTCPRHMCRREWRWRKCAARLAAPAHSTSECLPADVQSDSPANRF